MRLRALTLASFAFVLLLAAAPTASACHKPGNVALGCDWEDPPFGVVPYTEDCAESLGNAAVGACNYVGFTAYELLYGCPAPSSAQMCYN